jgi:anti-sigma B factor antagonist
MSYPAVDLMAPDPGQLLSVTAAPGDQPGQTVVTAAGEVDAFTAPLLEACLCTQARRRGVRELVVDLRQVTFLGAAGVALLARVRWRCQARGARLVLRCGGRRSVLRPLKLTGLADRVIIDPGDAPSDPVRDARTAARPAVRRRRPQVRRPRRVCR